MAVRKLKGGEYIGIPEKKYRAIRAAGGSTVRSSGVPTTTKKKPARDTVGPMIQPPAPEAGMMYDTRGLGFTGGYPLVAGGGIPGLPDNSGVTAPPQDLGDILGSIPGVGGYLEAGYDIYRGFTGGSGQGSGEGCAEGRIRIKGKCVAPGDIFPGGDPFITDAGGVPATNGQKGSMASMLGGRTPQIVGSINGNPIRRCQTGWVLGIDDLCYHKKVLPAQFRKWKKEPKAKISAYDWKMMNKYGPGGSKQRQAKEFAQAAGFSCKKK